MHEFLGWALEKGIFIGHVEIREEAERGVYATARIEV